MVENTSPENILLSIRQLADDMSLRQRMVAEFILANPETLGLLSVTEFAQRAGVSSATMIRFCRKLGYEGFKQFSRAVQHALQAEFTAAGRFAQDRERKRRKQGVTQLGSMTKILEAGIQDMLHAIEHCSGRDISRCIGIMTEATKIYVVGGLISESLVTLFRHQLAKVTNKVYRLDTSPLNAATSISCMDSNTLVFAIAYPRYPKETITLTELARERGCKVVVLTNSEISPLTRYADIVFSVPVSTVSYADILAAPLAFLCGLTIEYSRKNQEEANKNLKSFDSAAMALELFSR